MIAHVLKRDGAIKNRGFPTVARVRSWLKEVEEFYDGSNDDNEERNHSGVSNVLLHTFARV